MSLSPQWLDELRARTVLSTLIGRTIKVTKAGREYKACCPFHNEKTPSFTINDDKGFYHCFGCSAHGDAIRWMTDQRGLPFIDAVKELAQAAGLDVPASDPRAAERAEQTNSLYDVMAAAAEWFAAQLQGLGGADARAYLERRGINGTTIKSFGLGFAPDSRTKLRSALARFGDAQLIEAGLLIAVDNKDPYDRFRGRLMIPIRDARARVIAFGGRILGSGEPKYLNSPDTPLFDKGRTLYNLDLAGPASRKTNRIIVVEGYMDVIALAQVGLADVVAPLGTALTEHQLERLWRLADVPLLCLDGDSAGQKAALRAAARALPMLAPAKSLGFATLPAGLDPDDLVRASGVQALNTVLATPEALVDKLWTAEVQAQPLTTPEERAGLRHRLRQHCGSIVDENVRSQYDAEFRDRFDTLFQRAPPRLRERFLPNKRGGFGRPAFERPVSSGARSIGGGGVEPMIARSIVAGLLRYPGAIRANLEPLSALTIADEALDRLRIVLIDAAYDNAQLDSDMLLPICDQAGLGDLSRSAMTANGLAFSFTSRHAEAELAQRDLGMAIEALAARPALDAALAAATACLKEKWDENGFAEQQRLLGARQAADQRLAELAGSDDETGKQV